MKSGSPAENTGPVERSPSHHPRQRTSAGMVMVVAILLIAAGLVACSDPPAMSSSPPASTATGSRTPTPQPIGVTVQPLGSTVLPIRNGAQPTSTTVLPSPSPSLSPSPSPTPARGLHLPFSIYLPLIPFQIAPTATPQPTPSPTGTPTVPPTQPPQPTPVPTVQVDTQSKLGLHVIRNNSPNITNAYRRVRMHVAKGVDDFSWLQTVKQVSPKTVTIGRIALPEQPMSGDPKAMAQEFVARYLPTYQANPWVDYWEGYNEPDANLMDWYAQFETARARIMAGYGLHVAVGNFGTGVPEYQQFLAFLPAIQAAKDTGGILGLHEYSAPTMQTGVGSPLPGVLPQPDRGTLTLRYRWWYDDFLKPRGLVIPLVITEAGIDGMIPHPGPQGKGWQDFGGFDLYLKQLAWYDSELRLDDYVLGFTVFTAGEANDLWPTYGLNNELPTLAEWVASQQ